MKIATCLALLLCGAVLPAHPIAQDAAAASQPAVGRFFLRGGPAPVQGFYAVPLGTEPTTDSQASEDLDALRAQHDEISAHLERLELESELARMEREHEHRRNLRAQHRELESAIAQTEEQREDMEHLSEIQEEDFQEQWESLEATYSTKREQVEQRFESECEEARGRFDLELIEKRNSLEDDSAIEAFDAGAQLEWSQQERNYRQQQAEVLAQMEGEYVEARRSARAEWRALQEDVRSNLRQLDRQKLSFEQRLEDLDEEGDSELEISEMRARAEVLEETRAVQGELDRVERAMDRAEEAANAEDDEACAEPCEEPGEEADEMVETEESDEYLDTWIEAANEDVETAYEAADVYVDEESDVSSEIDELTGAVEELRSDVDELRKEVEGSESVREREEGARGGPGCSTGEGDQPPPHNAVPRFLRTALELA
jgi:hypothetical protein